MSVKIESDRGTEFYNSNFQNLSKVKSIHHYSRFRDRGPSIAERVTRTITNLIKKRVCLKRIAAWISEIPTIIKQYKNTINSSKKRPPIELVKKVRKK